MMMTNWNTFLAAGADTGADAGLALEAALFPMKQ